MTRILPNSILVAAVVWLLLMSLHDIFEQRQISRTSVMSIGAAMLCALALGWRRERKVNFSLLLVSVGLALYLAEFVLLLVHLQGQRDERISRLVEVLRTKGIDAFPALAPSQWLGADGLGKVFPLAGLANVTTALCKEGEQPAIYPSDEHGFNNPRGTHSSDIDLVLVGDSFTHGACVNAGEDVGSRLRALNWKVLNLGYASDGPLLELGTLKEYGAPLKPKAVLWLYFEGNDLYDLEAERRSSLLLQYLKAGFSQGLAARQPEISQALRRFVQERSPNRTALERLRESELFLTWRLSRLREVLSYATVGLPLLRTSAYRIDDPALFALFETILTRARDTVASWGGTLYLVYLPSSLRYIDGVDHELLFSRGRVLSVAQQLRVPVIDFHAAFQASGETPSTLFPYPGAHYSRQGYSLLAATIDRSLAKGRAPAASRP